MDNKYIKEGLTDVLVRVEGTIKINEQGNSVRVHTKLQGIKDKLIHLIKKLEGNKQSESEELKEKIRITVGTKDESN